MLAAALLRFGCCSVSDASALARRLIDHGRAEAAHGHEIRMVAVGGNRPEEAPSDWHFVALDTVIHGLRQHVSEQWARQKPFRFGNPVLDLLALLECVEPPQQPPAGSERGRENSS